MIEKAIMFVLFLIVNNLFKHIFINKIYWLMEIANLAKFKFDDF